MSADAADRPTAGSIEQIRQMIESNVGDRGRLEYIMRCVEGGTRLHSSDLKYLSALEEAAQHEEQAVPDEKPAVPDEKPEPDEPAMIIELLRCKHGDQGRLKHMASMLEDGRQLYKTDAEYLRGRYCEVSTPGHDQGVESGEPRQSENGKAASSEPQQEDDGRKDGLAEAIRETDRQIRQERAELDTQVMLSGELARKKAELEQIKTKLFDVSQEVEKTRSSLQDLGRHKEQLARSMQTQDVLSAQIAQERQEIRDMIEKQRVGISEQVRAADEIRAERAELEKESGRLAKVIDDAAAERKKLMDARKELRSLKSEERKMAKTQKDMDKASRDIQKERDKIAKRLEDEKTKLEGQKAVKAKLDEEIAELEKIKGQRETAKKDIKLAQKVVRAARTRKAKAKTSSSSSSSS